MTCAACGAELPAQAKFCPECGSAVEALAEHLPETEVISAHAAEADLHEEEAATEVLEAEAVEPGDGSPAIAPEDVDVPMVDPADPVAAPPTEVVEPHHDATTTGVTRPALQRLIETPPREPKPRRERRPLEERGTFEEFLGAMGPLVRAPRFSANLLAAVIALLVSGIAALLLWLLVDNGVDGFGTLLPGFVDSSEDRFGVSTLLGLGMHQVPMVSGDDVQHSAPLLLVLVPLLACALGVYVARRVMPCSGKPHGFLERTLPFALMYGVLTFLWSLFGAQDWHAAHGRSLLAGIVIAAIGAWLAERFWLRREAPAAGTPAAAPAPAPGRFGRAVRIATHVFALMVAFGALGILAGSIVAITGDDSFDEVRGDAIVSSVLQVVEGGFEAVGYGVMAEGDPFSGADDEEGWRVWELDEVLTDAATVIFVAVSFLVVVIGGLFSGFAIARGVEPRSRNDHALFGAITGLVWGIAMLLAHFLVLSRFVFDDDTHTTFDGSETFLLSLLVGSVLGALGGLLAAHSHAEVPEAITGEETAA